MHTIAKLLKQSGLRLYVKIKEPFLSPKNYMKKLDFVQKYESWMVEDWEQVFFSDKTMVGFYGLGSYQNY